MYIYVCDSRVCSLSGKGWNIYRNQQNTNLNNTQNNNKNNINAPANAVFNFSLVDSKPTSTPQKNTWTFDANKDIDDDFSFLNDLIEKRDANILANLNDNSKEKKKEVTEKNDNISEVFCYIVEEVAEPYEDHDDFNTNSASNEKISKMLASYFEDEEDTETTSIIKSNLKVNISDLFFQYYFINYNL